MSETPKEATEYVILRSTREFVEEGPETARPETWAVVGKAKATNAEAAVNAFLDVEENAQKHGEGFYRGVPARSWPAAPFEKRRKVSFR